MFRCIVMHYPILAQSCRLSSIPSLRLRTIFALSIWETISEYKANANRPKALGWPLLKIYYSGFFAGHALMRAVGQAIVRVEPRQAKRLTEIGQLFCGNPFSVSPGNYELRTEQASDRYCQLGAEVGTAAAGAAITPVQISLRGQHRSHRARNRRRDRGPLDTHWRKDDDGGVGSGCGSECGWRETAGPAGLI